MTHAGVADFGRTSILIWSKEKFTKEDSGYASLCAGIIYEPLLPAWARGQKLRNKKEIYISFRLGARRTTDFRDGLFRGFSCVWGGRFSVMALAKIYCDSGIGMNGRGKIFTWVLVFWLEWTVSRNVNIGFEDGDKSLSSAFLDFFAIWMVINIRNIFSKYVCTIFVLYSN